MVSGTSRREALRAVGVVGFAGVSGCASSLPLAGPHHHHRDAVLDGPATVWPTLRGNARRSGYRPDGRSISGTASVERIADGGAYSEMQPAIGPDGIVYGVDRRDQDDRIEFAGEDTFTGFVSTGPDGAERWTVSQRSGHAAPTIVGDTVFLTSAGTTRAIDRRDGSPSWRYEVGYGYPEVSPTVVDGTVYVCDDRLYALDARTGERQWSSLGGTAALYGTAATSEALYAAAGSNGAGGVFRIEPANGSGVWTAPEVGECYTHPVVGADHVYAVETRGRLHALDPATGRTQWVHSLRRTAYIPPAVAGDTVYVAGENDEYVYALSARDGSVRWKDRIGPNVPSAPSVGGDAVYVPVGDQDSGTLYAYDKSSGEQRHQWSLPLSPSASIALGNTYAAICAGETTEEGRVLVVR